MILYLNGFILNFLSSRQIFQVFLGICLPFSTASVCFCAGLLLMDRNKVNIRFLVPKIGVICSLKSRLKLHIRISHILYETEIWVSIQSNIFCCTFFLLYLEHFALDNDDNRTVIYPEESINHNETSQNDSLPGSAPAQLRKLTWRFFSTSLFFSDSLSFLQKCQ